MPFLLCLLALLAIAAPAHAALLDFGGQPVPAGRYQRIVSLAPSNTELLYAIGWGDRVVGVTDACDYPAQARSKSKVGAAESLSVERVLALKPDLVLGIPSKAPVYAQLARMLKVPLAILPSDDLESVAANAEGLGAIIGPEGKRFAVNYRRQLAAIAPSRSHPKVFFMVWDRPLMSAGPKTFLDDLVKRAGGRNVVTAPGYATFSEEALIASAPDVIAFSDNLRPAAERLKARLKRPRLVALPADDVSRPGPRVIGAIQRAAKAFDQGS
ncbi:ABC transporter substrate-binding protein [bacterium]|nr:ABC transporter substrate-binding protein [bacterium]